MSTRINKGSSNHTLASMSVGDRIYVETTLVEYPATMRSYVTPKSRRPPELEGRDFNSTLFTCIAAARAGDVRYLVCVERTR